MTWQDDVRAAERRVRARLMTASEFDATLDGLVRRRGSPVLAVSADFQGPSPMPVVTVGRAGSGEPNAVDTWATDDQGLFQVRTGLWWASGGNEIHEAARRAMRELLAAWWRGDGRNEKSRLPSGQSAATQRALEETLRVWVADGPVVFCAADIDNFGRVNNILGWPAGDDLIGRLGAALLERGPRDCLVVHRSGDEFSILFPPSTAPGEAIALLTDIRDQVEQVLRDNTTIEPPVPGFSMGIAICAEWVTYGDLEDVAGRALKPEGVKQRGRVSVARPPERPLPDNVAATELQLLCAVNLLGQSEPFQDPLLDAASVIARNLCDQVPDLPALAERLPGALARLSDRDATECPPPVLIAAAHGVARAALAGTGPITLDRVTVLLSTDGAAVSAGEESIVVAGSLPPADARVVAVRGTVPNLLQIDAKRSVLVTIGDSELHLPAELFAAVVYVDDRPTTGGGLPDFWEAAVAQVVASVSRNPNVDRVFVAGRRVMGKQTIARLNNATEWTSAEYAELLARRLGTASISRIRETGARIAGRVVEVDSAADVVAVLLADLEQEYTIRPLTDADPVPQPPRLKRILLMEDMLPGKDYGCRVATASEAFPVALDIVREIEEGLLEDQTGRAFRELVDFRIHLETPRVEPVPRFYLADQELLDEYFDREFIQDSGLFRSLLDEHGQLNAVVDHVAKVVTAGRFTSRRALLVVPHVPVPDRDLSPLGLVSGRIIPRPISIQSVRLDFSFSWRTVEALVGLPYSLYGSIRFAEHITGLVSDRLSPNSPVVSMGTLSYIAHSLHMFVDEYAEQVARRIVNDDSL